MAILGFYVLSIICFLGVVFQAIFIAVEHKEKYVPAVIFKGLASCCFMIMGFLGYKNAQNGDFAKLVLLGLIFGALGDILLNLRFVFAKKGQLIFLIGIAAFLTGHILYLAALIPLSSSLLVSVIAGVVLAAILLAIIFKKFEVKIAFKIFGIFYIGAIAIMTVVAIGNLFALQDTNRILYAVGAVAFLISDVVLIFNTFGSETKFSMRITNLAFYYVGQLLIAFSLFFI